MGEPLKPGHYPGIAQSPIGEAIRAGHLPGGVEGEKLRERWEKLQDEKQNKNSQVLIDNAGQPATVINKGKG